jgi:hypothetical protein
LSAQENLRPYLYVIALIVSVEQEVLLALQPFSNKTKVRVNGTASCFSRTSESGYDFSFYFCPSCGNTVYWETTRKQGFVVVAAGAFADPNFPAPTQSAFEEHQHPWLKILP